MSDYQHIWTLSVSNVCRPSRLQDYNYVAPADIEKAFAVGKELLTKKHPNPYKDDYPNIAWHPDLAIVGIKRGLELDNDEEGPW